MEEEDLTRGEGGGLSGWGSGRMRGKGETKTCKGCKCDLGNLIPF